MRVYVLEVQKGIEKMLGDSLEMLMVSVCEKWIFSPFLCISPYFPN